MLLRACDCATADRPAAAALFWTLGPNQVGKAAIAAWRDLLVPGLARDPTVRLWPFEGSLAALIEPGRVTVAETYPADSLRQLRIRLAGSKRRRGDRTAVAPGLQAALDGLGAAASPALGDAIADGFGADPAGEDRFDSLIGLLGMLNVIEGRSPDGVPDDPWISRWEGWVLGQKPVPAAGPGRGRPPVP
jgi:hypothetical protein